jgi:hypothetical protein
MPAHRFGKKLKFPSTLVIKHQLRMLVADDARKKAKTEAIKALAGERPMQVGILERSPETFLAPYLRNSAAFSLSPTTV